MIRAQQPGHVVYSGGKAYRINRSGDYEPFDHKRYRDARPWARGARRDEREMVL